MGGAQSLLPGMFGRQTGLVNMGIEPVKASMVWLAWRSANCQLSVRRGRAAHKTLHRH